VARRPKRVSTCRSRSSPIRPEAGGNRIRKVDHATGIITTIAGDGTPGYSGDGGPAAQAEINHPVDVAIADDNTIYFSDVYNHCIRKIDPSGIISSVAGACHFTPEGEPGKFSGDGGPPLEAQLYKPYGIDLVGNRLYVSDSYNNRLRVVNLP
jgi:DNA-binding beta-propeller fold protein YncE